MKERGLKLMRRTQENTDITQHFTGVQEVGSEFGGRIDEIHGMWDNPMTSLTRIPGKLLATTGLADGPIWSLYQLRFQDSILMLSQEGPNFVVGRESLPYTGQVYPIPEFSFSSSTEGPYIDWPDWPDWPDWLFPFSLPEWEAHKKSREEETSRPPSSSPPRYDYSLILSPSSLYFEQVYGHPSLDFQTFDLTVEGVFPAITISQSSPTGVLGDLLGVTYVGGSSNYAPAPNPSSIQQTYKVGVSAFSLAPGYYTSLIPLNTTTTRPSSLEDKEAFEQIACFVKVPEGLYVTPDDLSYHFFEGDTAGGAGTLSKDLIVGNSNEDCVALQWTAAVTCPLNPGLVDHISLSLGSGSLLPSGCSPDIPSEQTVTVTVDPTLLAQGAYRFLITFTDQFGSYVVATITVVVEDTDVYDLSVSLRIEGVVSYGFSGKTLDPLHYGPIADPEPPSWSGGMCLRAKSDGAGWEIKAKRWGGGPFPGLFWWTDGFQSINIDDSTPGHLFSDPEYQSVIGYGGYASFRVRVS